MNEEIISAFDAYTSSDNDMISQADAFLHDQIGDNQTLFIDLFTIFENSQNLHHQKLSLIVANTLVKKNFTVVQQNLQEFSRLLYSSIMNSRDKNIFLLLAEIVYQIVLKIDEIWDDFQGYLTLYRDQIDFLPFCIYLYASSFKNQDLNTKYKELLKELNEEIIYNGLLYEEPSVQISSTFIFTKTTKKYAEEYDLLQYQKHLALIQQIAENSLEMEKDNFLSFWSQIVRINQIYSEPFFKIAQQFLGVENLDPDKRMKLLQFIIQNYHLIGQEDIEPIINDYFNVQLLVDDVDQTGQIFLCMSYVNREIAYELFKNNVFELLNSEEAFMQYIGIVMTHGLAITYMKEIVNDISFFIDVSLKIATNSTENFTSISDFLLSFLSMSDLDYDNREKVYSFLTEAFTNQLPIDIQFNAYQICQGLGESSVDFDKFVYICEKVPLQSLSNYFSCLIYVHSYKNNMTFEKYDPFFSFLVNTFQQSCQKVEELAAKHNESPEDPDLAQEYYNFLLLRGSSANLIFYLSYFNPLQLEELVELTIKTFIDMIKIRDLSEFESSITFSLKNLKDDFTFIFDHVKHKAIDLIRPYYYEIIDADELDALQSIITNLDVMNFPSTTSFIKNFKYIYDDFLKNHKFTPADSAMTIKYCLDPMSKWIYQISNPNLHRCFVKYVICFTKCLAQVSFHALIFGTKILRRIVKPFRTSFNESNEWYFEICAFVNSSLEKYVTEDLQNLNVFIYGQSFMALVNIMMAFIYSKNDFGHEFLAKKILPFYENDQTASEVDLLYLFADMIDLNYYTEEECGIMIQIVDAIIGRGNAFLDSRPQLFNLLTKLSKINPNVSAQYFQFALSVFNDVKDEQLFIDTKAFCSYFLLSSYNQNQDELADIAQQIPEFLSVFPLKYLVMPLFEEIKILLEHGNLPAEINEAIVSAFIRYFSYQKYASNIFHIRDEQHNELLDFFKNLIEMFLGEVNEENLQMLLEKNLPEQPTSAQYILSLY